MIPPSRLIAFGAFLLVVAWVYLPGLHGSWLVDDITNLEIFQSYNPHNAPYLELVFGNGSGPLGRPVAMASFALNHMAGLFSTYALKATSLFIHLCNAVVLFFFLYNLFSVKPATQKISPATLAAALACCWAILPLHTSSVLYIVQRMTLLASFFSLLCLLGYVMGRRQISSGNTWRGLLAVGFSLLVCLPLAVFAKESAFSVIPWLLLLELFLFQPRAARHLPGILLGLSVATIVAAITVVVVFKFDKAHLWRDFSLTERLLTEARAVCSYARNTFLPENAVMGVFHDDYVISTGLFQPWTTAPALLAIAGLLLAGILLARSSLWMVALGILLFLSGHLIESTVIPLELYFEHRNYLPAVGLLLAASHLLLASPLSRNSLAILFFLYLSVLVLSTHQRSQTWGDNDTLLMTSAMNHPRSVRAWTDYTENLVTQGQGLQALEADSIAARQNPEMASIFYLQMISIYCRSNQTPPPALIQLTANSLATLPANRPSAFISISTGLDFILTQHLQQECGKPDFSPMARGILVLDRNLSAHFGAQRGRLWSLRLVMADWLQALDKTDDAVRLLQDAWDNSDRSMIPMVGLGLAQALAKTGDTARLGQVLDQLELTADNPPPDFQAEMKSLRSRHQE